MQRADVKHSDSAVQACTAAPAFTSARVAPSAFLSPTNTYAYQPHILTHARSYGLTLGTAGTATSYPAHTAIRPVWEEVQYAYCGFHILIYSVATELKMAGRGGRNTAPREQRGGKRARAPRAREKGCFSAVETTERNGVPTFNERTTTPPPPPPFPFFFLPSLSPLSLLFLRLVASLDRRLLQGRRRYYHRIC